MSAFIPNRREPEVTEKALDQVRIDKEREAGDGSDGTWVAHPDLVPVAREIFDGVLGERPNQKDRVPEAIVTADELLNVEVAGGRVTEAGVRTNVSVALQYLASWLAGNGAAAINNLMEDAARPRSAVPAVAVAGPRAPRRRTTDDRRGLRHHPRRGARPATSAMPGYRWTDAAALLDDLVLSDEFAEFLTLAAYPRLG